MFQEWWALRPSCGIHFGHVREGTDMLPPFPTHASTGARKRGALTSSLSRRCSTRTSASTWSDRARFTDTGCAPTSVAKTFSCVNAARRWSRRALPAATQMGLSVGSALADAALPPSTALRAPRGLGCCLRKCLLFGDQPTAHPAWRHCGAEPPPCRVRSGVVSTASPASRA